MPEVHCPTCGTTIDPTDRCHEYWGVGQCMENQGHNGWHRSEIGTGDGSVLIWTGLFSKHSCPARLSLSRWCQKSAGHEGPHNDGHGVSWAEEQTPSPGAGDG